MLEAALASVFLLIFIACRRLGTWLQGHIAADRRSTDEIESVRLIVTIIVTFSALVLGLLVNTAKDDFDNQTDLYRKYGIDLAEFHRRLVEYGPAAEPIEHLLRSYTAAVFVLTWPSAARPAGDYPTRLKPIRPGSDEMAALSNLVRQIDNGLEHLQPTDAYHQRIASKLQDWIHVVEDDRWHVIERVQSKLSSIFVGLLVTWLAIAFFTFGLVSPNTAVVHMTVFLAAFAVASSLYLIIDLNTPLGGFIAVSGQPFQDALWHMDHETTP